MDPQLTPLVTTNESTPNADIVINDSVLNPVLVFPFSDVNGQTMTLGNINNSTDINSVTTAQLLGAYRYLNPTPSVEIPPGDKPEVIPATSDVLHTATAAIGDHQPAVIEVDGVKTTIQVVSRLPCDSSQPEVVKKRGGWPKGKKRKIEPSLIKSPRPPVTAYVLFATERRQQLRQSNPEMSFTEVTRLAGNDWSNMDPVDKQKYMDRALLDKKRYIEELKEYQTSEEYKNFMKAKRDKNDADSSNTTSDTICDDNSMDANSLHCQVCNVYFSSAHNRKEHIFGRHHLQNLTNEFHQELLQKEKQLEKERQCEFEASVLELRLSEGGSTCDTEAIRSNNSAKQPRSSCFCGADDSLSIESFVEIFMEKNNERDLELTSLRKQVDHSQAKYKDHLQHVQFLKDRESKLMEEWESIKSHGLSLSAQIDGLKMVPHLFGLVNF